jgi:hypothetical protein
MGSSRSDHIRFTDVTKQKEEEQKLKLPHQCNYFNTHDAKVLITEAEPLTILDLKLFM